MNRIKKVLLVATAAWTFRFNLAEVLMQATAASSKERYLANNPETTVEKFWSLIEEDSKVILANPYFNRGSAGSNDASEFLNPLVGWNGAKGKLELDLKLVAAVSEKDYTSQKLDWAALKLDFGWLKALATYDHWNYDQHGPAYQPEIKYTITAAPIPDFGSFLPWVRLRLLKGRDEHDLPSAFKEIDHLAELILTAENILPAMVAVSFFGVERKFYETLDSAAQLGIKPPPPQTDVQRFKRYLYAQGNFLDVRLTDTTFNKLAAMPAGRCIRVSAAIRNAIGFRKLMKSDFKASLDRIDRVVNATAKECRQGFLRKMWRDPNYEALFGPNDNIFAMATAIENNGASQSEKNDQPAKGTPFKVTISELEKHPRAALSLGYILSGIAEPNWFRAYESP
jgi:hypothetical protein